jgi:hypothetical protein
MGLLYLYILDETMADTPSLKPFFFSVTTKGSLVLYFEINLDAKETSGTLKNNLFNSLTENKVGIAFMFGSQTFAFFYLLLPLLYFAAHSIEKKHRATTIPAPNMAKIGVTSFTPAPKYGSISSYSCVNM